jgi:hypothetical protein
MNDIKIINDLLQNKQKIINQGSITIGSNPTLNN